MKMNTIRKTRKNTTSGQSLGGATIPKNTKPFKTVTAASAVSGCAGSNELTLTYGLKGISLNRAYPTGRNGRRYLDEDAAAFKEAVFYETITKVPWRATIDDRFVVTVHFIFKDKRRRDIDDYFKLLLDALTDAGVWPDDSQIVKLIGFKLQGEEKDFITVIIDKL